jgi:adenine-specific DNA methylase
MTKRRLIEDWLPIAALSMESSRERRIALAGSVLPPTTYLHVWFARRPLVASRAAVLGSLLEAGADRLKFLHTLGIHGNPVEAEALRDSARSRGESLSESQAYGYKRAFKYLPEPVESSQVVLDPTAGGGSIPLESIRLGVAAIANDLNPVASFLMKATIELPLRHGSSLLHRYRELAADTSRGWSRTSLVFCRRRQTMFQWRVTCGRERSPARTVAV